MHVENDVIHIYGNYESFQIALKFTYRYLLVWYTGPINSKVIDWLEVSQMID